MTPMDDEARLNVKGIVAVVVGSVVVLAVLIGLVFGLFTVKRQFSRSQALKDAKNSVRISSIEIQNQKQRVEIAKQKAEIRLQDAIGVRESQDEIAKTLTPLYVQFEMVEALKQIAQTGHNNSVVFLPSGANGIPLVYDAANAAKVGMPNEEKK
jgi:hypothetical protein